MHAGMFDDRAARLSGREPVAARPARPEPADDRLAELLCAMSFATGLALGDRMEHGLKSAYIGLRIAGALGLGAREHEAVYYGALLKDAGCSACAAGMAAFFPDDLHVPTADMLLIDPHRMSDVLVWMSRHVPADARLPLRMAKLLSFVAQCGHVMAEAMRGRCEVAELFARRLGFGEHVQQAVRFQLERWDGQGLAYGRARNDVPAAARILHLAQSVEIAHSVGERGAARALARERAGTRFDPEVTRAFLALAERADFWDLIEQESSQDAILALAPQTPADLEPGNRIDMVCEAVGDFVDSKTPQMRRHSLTVAAVAEAVARSLGLDAVAQTRVRRAALVHDVGKAAVPFGILAKGERLTGGEREQLRLHPYYTQRVLEQVRPLQALAPGAASHHEWVNGEGYHRQLSGEQIPLDGRILAVANTYARLTQARGAQAGADSLLHELRGRAGAQLDARCVEALAGSLGRPLPAPQRARREPGSLSGRETEVLHLLAQGMSNPQIAHHLAISRKTVEHHLDHIYTKLNLSSRTAAAVYAVQHGIA
jgi:HD-GYP domain-containing protein (c-di-GMP phosphodiesterase class II)